MNPIDEIIRRRQEQYATCRGVDPTAVPFEEGPLEPGSTVLREIRVHEGMSPDLEYEPGYDEGGDDGHGSEGELDLHSDLVLEESGVMFQPPIEEVIVGERRHAEIE
jgi:hypothetical protein